MRFNGLIAQELGPFRRRIEIDFDAIPGLLVALCGGNGQGKSTVLELLGGGLHRTTPTRGSLVDLATGRGAFLEERVTNGKSWTIRHTVDAVSGKSEAVVLDAHGAPVLPDSKVRSFDAWAAKHLPSPEVLYSSTFAPQGSGGFLEMKAGDRKAVLLRVLGIEALEGKAERAREKARAAKQALDVLMARIADERQRGGDLAEAARQLTTANDGAAAAEAFLTQHRTAFDAAQERAQAAEKERARHAGILAELARIEGELTALARKRGELGARITNNQAVLDEADAIRSAVVRTAEIDAEIAKLGVDQAGLEQVRLAHGRDAETTAKRCNELMRAIADAEERERRATARLADREAIEKAAAELAGETVLASEDSTREIELGTELAVARAAGLDLASKRLLELRPFVDRVANNEIPADEVGDRACDVIAEDNRLVADALAAPGEVARLDAECAAHRERARRRQERIRQLESLAARAETLKSAQADLEDAQAEIKRHRAELSYEQFANESARKGQLDVAQKLKALTDTYYRLTSERDGLKAMAKKAEPLANAEARLAELRPQLEEIDARAQALRGDAHVIAPEPGYQPPAPVDLQPFRARLERAEQDARAAHGMIKVAEARLESARLTQRKLGELEGQRGALESDLADWTLLADSLGRDGLQAMLIDAAGPELTELINDLLRTCVGSRWTVTIETTRPSADGKKQIEGCEVRVLDTERGRDATAESLSGGERVLVGEAVSLALSMLACRRSGVQGATLIRDESGAALDPQNARNYVAMLRRAAELVGASKVLFVSHAPEVQELADARIVVKDGTVEVAA